MKSRVLCVAPYDPRTSGGHAGGVFLQSWLRSLADHFEVQVLTWEPFGANSVSEGDFGGIPVAVYACRRPVSPVRRLADGLGPPNEFASWLSGPGGRPYVEAADLVEVQWPSASGLVRRLKKGRTTPVAYVTHDLRSEALLSLAMASPRGRYSLTAFAKFVRCWPQELRALRAADQIWCFREGERQLISRFRPRARIDAVTPTFPYLTVEAVAGRPPSDQQRTRLAYVADMSRIENKVAMSWFLREIWPELRAAIQDVALDIVGRCDDASYIASHQAPGVVWRGWVDDLADVYRDTDVAVVPARIRGGIKFKVAEALAYGVGVVSSPIGAEGYPANLGGALRVAHTAHGWAAAVEDLANVRRADASVGAKYAYLVATAFPAGRDSLLAHHRYAALIEAAG
jgi:glycosyltransferase involved in cell wall biosynthesis